MPARTHSVLPHRSSTEPQSDDGAPTPESDPTLLLESYLARLQAGESVGKSDLDAHPPKLAAELWRRIAAWENVACALPGLPGSLFATDERALAIQFLSIGSGTAAERLIHEAATPAVLAQRIAERAESIGRYQVVEEIARGAMGAILRVRDTDLGRDLAMKVMLSRDSVADGDHDRSVTSAAVARFVEEARITGRLEHPGIPPVYDFGTDREGNFYFTMPWIHGHTLREVFERVRKGTEGWSRTRALGLLLNVCDALAYAHTEGVVHRDLKPRNIMVGEFGGVFVLDWGLARDNARSQEHDVRLAPPDKHGNSPVVTRDGLVLGTPCYMSPEQARGELDGIGVQTDVYALGAILYELLAGHPPYAPNGSNPPAYGVVRQVREGPPASLASATQDVSPELIAICEKAMAREPQGRFADMREFGAELRAFLEGGVVRAHATGAWVGLCEWVRRHRGVAALSAVLAVVLIGAGFELALVERSLRESMRRELDLQAASELLQSADSLPLIGRGAIERLEAWTASAQALESRLELYTDERLRRFDPQVPLEVEPDPDARPPFDPTEIRYLEFRRDNWTADVAERRERLDEHPPAEEAARLQREIDILTHELAVLSPRIVKRNQEWQAYRPERLVDVELEPVYKQLWNLETTLGLILRPESGALQRVQASLEQARRVDDLCLEQSATAWSLARDSIRSEECCPLYEGLDLEPLAGLVPVRRNAAGLWEFWHVLSGARPIELVPGVYEITPETGLIFILVPGGARPFALQVDDPSADNCVVPNTLCAGHLREESPVHRPPLAPYFLSKYELTQAQWSRLTGSNPSEHYAGFGYRNLAMISPTHPVEHVSWTDCDRALERWGLALPTEAQWEVAARADTDGPYVWGACWPPPAGGTNDWDQCLSDTHAIDSSHQPETDRYAAHAPVDALGPNGWGFYNMSGNVAEWCADWFEAGGHSSGVRPGTGLLTPEYSTTKANRGGGFKDPGDSLRVSRRAANRVEDRMEDLGVRPVFSPIE